MDLSPTARHAEALRAFNRFYTRRIGVVGERVLDSPYSLAETRVLWEIVHGTDTGAAVPAAADAAAPPRRGPTASTLARTLGLDAGYLSRLLAGLRRRGLVQVVADPADRRRRQLRLTATGRRAFAPLERRSQQQMQALLAPLSAAERRELLGAAGRIGTLLGERRSAPAGRAPAAAPIRLRAPRPGDMGWVVSRHGALYAEEYGWDWTFEALVARIAADFVERFDPAREACWIAEREGGTGAERLGCVFLVHSRDERSHRVEPGVAQLRMLLVDPAARGQGLGRRLVQECERFARARGYRRIRLWTNSVLLAARGIYQAEGYRLVARERHTSFGKKLVGETWEKALS